MKHTLHIQRTHPSRSTNTSSGVTTPGRLIGHTLPTPGVPAAATGAAGNGTAADGTDVAVVRGGAAVVHDGMDHGGHAAPDAKNGAAAAAAADALITAAPAICCCCCMKVVLGPDIPVEACEGAAGMAICGAMTLWV